LWPELKPRYFKGNGIVWQIAVHDIAAARHGNVFPEFVIEASLRLDDPKDAPSSRNRIAGPGSNRDLALCPSFLFPALLVYDSRADQYTADGCRMQ
jgi:hypothetical protein